MTEHGGQHRGRGNRYRRRGVTAPRALLPALVMLMAFVAVPAASAANPANPLLAGTVSNSGSLSGAVSVAVSGNYAYSPSYYSGVLNAVDISNPAAPFVAGQSASSNALLNASTINIAGGLAYVVSKNANGPCLPGPSPMCSAGTNDNGTGNSLSIYDISTNPRTPTLVGPPLTDSTKLFGAYGIAVAGNDAYVAAQGCLSSPQPCPDPTVGNRFNVIDVSNPAAPTFVASLTNPTSGPFKNALSHATSVAIHGTDAYVTAFNSSHLTVIDISNPASPAIVASITNPALIFPSDVVVGPTVQNTTYAYVANQSSGGPVTVVDVSTPSSPQVVGSVTNSTLNGAYRIRLHGNFAYVSGSSAATVTGVDISDPTNPSVAWSVTNTAHLNKTTGLDVDSTGRYVVAVSPYLATENKPTFPPYPPASGAPTITGTISVIRLDPVNRFAPSIVAPAPPLSAGSQLSAVDGTWTGAPAPTFGYQWSRCPVNASCAPIAGATSSTYIAQSSDVGATLEVTVTGTNSLGSSSATSAPTSTAVTGPPVNRGLPTISGTPAAGLTLTASSGSWSGFPPPTFVYQWFACDTAGVNCHAISAATSTYTPTAADVGSTIEVTVTADNNIGSSPPTATSPPTAVVRPALSPPPSVSITTPATGATYTQGQTVTASYACAAHAAGAQLVSCAGPVGNGSSIDTATPGAHSFTVAAMDTGNLKSSRTALYTVLARQAPGPAISGAAQSHKTWRESAKPPHTIAGKPKPKHLPTGTTFSLTLNEPASVNFSFALKSTGRKVGGHCRAQTSQNRGKQTCTLTRSAGTLVFAARKGANRLSFSGHLPHGKKLRPGAYTVAITATAAGKRSKTATLTFTVAP